MPFTSYAPDHEDVVLWRALGHVRGGRYAEIAPGPQQTVLTRGLYAEGWDGVVVLSDEQAVARHGDERPRDLAVLSGARLTRDMVEGAGDGQDAQVHAVVVGATERARQSLVALVADGIAPWVVVLLLDAEEEPATPLPLEEELGHQLGCVLVLGTARVLLAAGRPAMRRSLAWPPSRRDGYVDAVRSAAEDDLVDALRFWRGRALESWAVRPAPEADERLRAELDDARSELEHARREIDALRRTLSWRVTRPLRAVRRRIGAE